MANTSGTMVSKVVDREDAAPYEADAVSPNSSEMIGEIENPIA